MRARVLTIVLIASLVPSCLCACSDPAEQGEACAVVHAYGVDDLVLPLSRDCVETVETELGVNVVEVKDGRVHVREANCPHQDCVSMAWIQEPGPQIVCLPHRLWIEIVSRDQATDVVSR